MRAVDAVHDSDLAWRDGPFAAGAAILALLWPLASWWRRPAGSDRDHSGGFPA